MADQKALKRQKELQDMEALLANMPSDGEDGEDDDYQPDPDLIEQQKFLQMGNNLIQGLGGAGDIEKDEKQQKKEKYQNNLKHIEETLDKMEDTGEPEDKTKVVVDSGSQDLINQIEQFQKQFAFLLDPQDQPPQNVQVKKAKASGSKIVDQDNIYSKIPQIGSIEALLAEKKNYMILHKKSTNEAEKNHAKGQVQNILNYLQAIKKKDYDGKLGNAKYLDMLDKCLAIQQDLYKQACSEENSNFKFRLRQRCAIIQKETQDIRKDPMLHYQGVISKLEAYFVPNQVEKMPENYVFDIDNKPQSDQIKVFATRNIEYLNLVKYYRANFPDKNNEVEQKLKPLLLEFKELMTELKAGNQPEIGKFLYEKAKEVDYSVFLGFPNQTYRARIKNWIAEFEKGQEMEQNFIDMVQGNKQYASKIESSQKKIQEYKLYINELNEHLESNKMIPIPKIQQITEDRNMKVINTKVDKFQLKVFFKRAMQCDSHKYKIKWNLEVQGQIKNFTTDWCNKSQGMVWNYQELITIGDRKNPFDNIHKKIISLSVEHKGFFSNENMGSAVINLSNLEMNHTYEDQIEIKKGDKKTMVVEFGCYLREPVASGNAQYGKINCYQIIQRYPQFDKNEGAHAYIEKCLREAQPVKEKPKYQKQVQQQPQQTQKVQIQQNQSNNKMPNQEDHLQNFELPILLHASAQPDMQYLQGIQDDQLPEGIPKEMILNPEDPNSFAFKSYLDILDKQLVTAIVHIGSTNRAEKKCLRSLSDAVVLMQEQLKNAMQNGDISEEDYQNSLLTLYEADQKLLEFYKKHKDSLQQEWAKFIEKRMELELSEMPQNLRQQASQMKSSKISENMKQSVRVQKPQEKHDDDEVMDDQDNNNNNDKAMEIENENQNQIPNEMPILEHDPGHPDNQKLNQISQDQLQGKLTKELILNPENPNIFNSLKYMKSLDERIPQAMTYFLDNGKRKEKKYLRNLSDQIYESQLKTETELKDGTLSQQQYNQQLLNLIDLDKQLLNFYNNIQLDQDWKGFISYRMNLIQQEK